MLKRVLSPKSIFNAVQSVVSVRRKFKFIDTFIDMFDVLYNIIY